MAIEVMGMGMGMGMGMEMAAKTMIVTKNETGLANLIAVSEYIVTMLALSQ